MVLSIDYSAGINLNSHCHDHSKKRKKEFYSLLFASLLPVAECRRHLQGSCLLSFLMPVLLKLFFFWPSITSHPSTRSERCFPSGALCLIISPVPPLPPRLLHWLPVTDGIPSELSLL